MRDDIVERLRARKGHWTQAIEVMEAAANEIELLRDMCVCREEFIAQNELWGAFGAWLSKPDGAAPHPTDHSKGAM